MNLALSNQFPHPPGGLDTAGLQGAIVIIELVVSPTRFAMSQQQQRLHSVPIQVCVGSTIRQCPGDDGVQASSGLPDPRL